MLAKADLVGMRDLQRGARLFSTPWHGELFKIHFCPWAVRE